LPRRRWLIAAAAAVVLAAAGVTVAETVGGNSEAGARTVQLAAFGVGAAPARATITQDGSMHIDATSLPHLDAEHFYEVWLTNRSRTQLQAVGSIAEDNKAVLTIAPTLMAQYRAIEVSVQRVNQTAYSGTSVLRGSYG
jgi:hypothetical protein